MTNSLEKNNFCIEEIEEKIGYSFKNKDLLEQAFTRISYSDERYRSTHNEIFEFIGDSIIGMIVVKQLTTRYEYNPWPEEILKKFDECIGYTEKRYFDCALDEAELSNLKIEFVQSSSLAYATEKNGLEAYLRMGKSDVINKVQEQMSVKEDLMEAIVGAIAIDSNWDMVILEKTIEKLINFDSRFENGLGDEPNYENLLAKWFSKKGQTLEFKNRRPINERINCRCSVNLGIDMLNYESEGYGKTLKEARRMASKKAIEFIQKTSDRASIIINAVGKPDLNRAVNQLQELYQKKIIPEPKYIFVEREKSSLGNPQWECWCLIEGLTEDESGYVCASKNEAKKYIAFEALNFLIGRDLKSLFVKSLEENNFIMEEI